MQVNIIWIQSFTLDQATVRIKLSFTLILVCYFELVLFQVWLLNKSPLKIIVQKAKRLLLWVNDKKNHYETLGFHLFMKNFLKLKLNL